MPNALTTAGSHSLSVICKRFVRNLTGSSFTKIFVLLAIVPTSILLRQSFNTYHSIGKLNLNYQASVESLNKPDLVSLDEFYRNEFLDNNSVALSTTNFILFLSVCVCIHVGSYLVPCGC
ncbi:uncharacterized protein LOC116140775 [Pistacia vera]|uniref:uncharacterized protein LOC116140775 n=1 Tax=Pistacia vera TaxID=55513 RepID=UPI0012634D11|nr:uncharacterized protein LOC116140775 [Pistacia vera]